MNAVPFLDTLVSEYLSWRGLVASAQTFDSERLHSSLSLSDDGSGLSNSSSVGGGGGGASVSLGASATGSAASASNSGVVLSASDGLSAGGDDAMRGFRVGRLVDSLLAHVNASDWAALEREWKHLCEFFARLRDPDAHRSVAALTLSLRRYFLVCAIQHGRVAVVSEFFAAMAGELRHEREWADWWQLPFVADPQSEPQFAVYFTRLWAENLVQSLHNLLCSVFQALPLPKLLQFNTERLKRLRLEAQIEFLQSDVQRLTSELLATQRRLSAAAAREEAGVPRGVAAGSSPSFALDDSAGGTQLSVVSSGAAAARRISAPLLRAGHQRERSASNSMALADDGEHASSAKGPLAVTPLRTLVGHTSAVTACRLSGDAAQLASAALDGTVRLWRVESEHCTDVRLPAGDALSLAFGRVLFAGTSTGSVALIDAGGTRGLLGSLVTGVECGVTRLAALPNNALAALCGASLKLFDTESAALTEVVSVEQPYTFAFSGSGALLAVGGADGTLTIRACNALARAESHWQAHARATPIVGVAFSSESTLVTLGADGVCAHWDQRQTSRPWQTVQEARHGGWWQRGASDVVWSSGFVLTGGGRQHCAVAFDFRDAAATPAAAVQRIHEHQASVTSVDMGGGAVVATGSVDNTIQVSRLAIKQQQQ